MHMNARFAVGAHRDIADEGSDFDLLLDGIGRYCFVSQSKNASLAPLNAPIAVTCAPPRRSFAAKSCRQRIASSPFCRMTAKVRLPSAS